MNMNRKADKTTSEVKKFDLAKFQKSANRKQKWTAKKLGKIYLAGLVQANTIGKSEQIASNEKFRELYLSLSEADKDKMHEYYALNDWILQQFGIAEDIGMRLGMNQNLLRTIVSNAGLIVSMAEDVAQNTINRSGSSKEKTVTLFGNWEEGQPSTIEVSVGEVQRVYKSFERLDERTSQISESANELAKTIIYDIAELECIKKAFEIVSDIVELPELMLLIQKPLKELSGAVDKYLQTRKEMETVIRQGTAFLDSIFLGKDSDKQWDNATGLFAVGRISQIPDVDMKKILPTPDAVQAFKEQMEESFMVSSGRLPEDILRKSVYVLIEKNKDV